MPETKKSTPSMSVDEPVEVRIVMGRSPHVPRLFILTAWRTPQGTVGHQMALDGHGVPQSLSNLQSKAPFPGKAVDGWQAEVIAFANAGLGAVVEVR